MSAGRGRRRGGADLSRVLEEGERRQLPLTSSQTQALIGQLTAADAATRLAGLDAVGHQLVEQGRLGPGADEMLPFLLTLATSSRYPEAAALLVRVGRMLAAIDEPPRSLAGQGGTEASRRAYDRVRGRAADLLRVARAGSDPEAARVAASVCARFVELDAQTEPLLIALLSGTADAEERSRLLYALTRVQLSRGGALHGRIAAALAADAPAVERLAVLLALSSHEPPEPLRGRAVAALREALSAPGALPDPCAWGRSLGEQTLRAALDRLR